MQEPNCLLIVFLRARASYSAY